MIILIRGELVIETEELILEKYPEKQIIDASLIWLKDRLDFEAPLLKGDADEHEIWLEFEENPPLHYSEFIVLDCDFFYNKGKKLRFSDINIIDWQNVLIKYL